MKKLYSISEVYKITYDLGRTLKYIRRVKAQKLLSSTFTERIMLAVTEVNQCAMCSYAHTKMALEAGLDKKEISDLLGGETSGIPEEEAAAILFAQHYADSRACPSEKAWDTLVETYGEVAARGILGIIRMITLGNTLGIPFGSLGNRIRRKKPDPRSSLGYELAAIFVLIFVTPIAIIHGLLASCFNKPLI